VQGTYIVAIDEAGEPTRGLFAFFNPGTLEGMRMVAFAFDFSDVSKAKFVARAENYLLATEDFFVYQFHQQCSENADCFGEYLEINDPPPTRSLGGVSSRMAWNDNTDLVCIAQTDYSSGQLTLGKAYQFTGPDTPEDSAVTTGCSVDTTHDADGVAAPVWGDHVFTTADLIFRDGDDADMVGGTGLQYYVDGVSLDGWNALTSTLTDTWLDASAF
jgi:hypothetical protein